MPRPHLLGERGARVAARDVRGHVGDAVTDLLQFGDDGCDVFGRADTAQDEIPAVTRERARDAEPNPARAAGYEGDGARGRLRR